MKNDTDFRMLKDIVERDIIEVCEYVWQKDSFGIALWRKYLSVEENSPLMLQEAGCAIMDLILNNWTCTYGAPDFDELEAMSPEEFLETVVVTAMESFNNAIKAWEKKRSDC